ncbi:hypothetical protein, partial [Streptomyces alkaliterrae]|uniref:hypothetical protein n=1 Tax=Streptomyces alkaliterrae TaxID=2213162 RepID=UPI001E5805F8
SRIARSRSSSGYLRGAAMVLVVLLRQDGNPGIRDSTNLGTAQGADDFDGVGGPYPCGADFQ